VSKYKKQQGRVPKIGIVALACCDCGLVHTMGFTIEKDNKLRIDYERNARATAQLRRGKFPSLKTGSGKWKMVRLEKVLE